MSVCIYIHNYISFPHGTTKHLLLRPSLNSKRGDLSLCKIRAWPIQLPCGVITISRACLHNYIILYIYVCVCFFWDIYCCYDRYVFVIPTIHILISISGARQHQGPRHLARPVLFSSPFGLP